MGAILMAASLVQLVGTSCDGAVVSSPCSHGDVLEARLNRGSQLTQIISAVDRDRGFHDTNHGHSICDEFIIIQPSNLL